MAKKKDGPSLKERLEAAERDLDEFQKNNPIGSDDEQLDPFIFFNMESFTSEEEN